MSRRVMDLSFDLLNRTVPAWAMGVVVALFICREVIDGGGPDPAEAKPDAREPRAPPGIISHIKKHGAARAEGHMRLGGRVAEHLRSLGRDANSYFDFVLDEKNHEAILSLRPSSSDESSITSSEPEPRPPEETASSVTAEGDEASSGDALVGEFCVLLYTLPTPD